MRFPIYVMMFLISLCANAQSLKLPPDPGPENNKTLNGIDSNNNNVRDDIEIFIFKKISAEKTIYMAYLKYAESMLLKIKYHNDNKKLKSLNAQEANDGLCLSVMDVSASKTKNSSILIREIYNTDERVAIDSILARKHHLVSNPVNFVPFERRRSLCRF